MARPRPIYPQYRVRPRSAVPLMTADKQPTPGFLERFRRLTRDVFSDAT